MRLKIVRIKPQNQAFRYNKQSLCVFKICKTRPTIIDVQDESIRANNFFYFGGLTGYAYHFMEVSRTKSVCFFGHAQIIKITVL